MDHLDPEAVAAYQDGGLAPAERTSAGAHLAECAECRDRLGAQMRAASGREAGARGSGSIGAPHDRRIFRERLAAAAIGALLLGAGLWWALDRAPAERAAAPRARETSPVTRIPAAPPDEVAGDAPDERSGAGEPSPRPPADDVEPELLALRGGARDVDGKTFRLQGDEWVDDAWTATPVRPPITLVRGTPAWRAALDQRPALARYAEVGPRVLVVLDSFAFRILPAP
jgi:type II secretory pathway component PulM